MIELKDFKVKGVTMDSNGHLLDTLLIYWYAEKQVYIDIHLYAQLFESRIVLTFANDPICEIFPITSTLENALADVRSYFGMKR